MDEVSKLLSAAVPATGSPGIDAEHGIQLGLLQAALAWLATPDSGHDSGHGTDRDSDKSADASELVEQLVTYSQAHFLSEQLLMRLAARSNYEGHVQQHEELMQDLDAVRTRMQSGDHAAVATLLRAHERRLLEHIRSWDLAV
jgi:hemerythrin